MCASQFEMFKRWLCCTLCQCDSTKRAPNSSDGCKKKKQKKKKRKKWADAIVLQYNHGWCYQPARRDWFFFIWMANALKRKVGRSSALTQKRNPAGGEEKMGSQSILLLFRSDFWRFDSMQGKVAMNCAKVLSWLNSIHPSFAKHCALLYVLHYYCRVCVRVLMQVALPDDDEWTPSSRPSQLQVWNVA